MRNRAHLCWSDQGLQELGSRKHLRAPSCPPTLFMFSLAPFILFPIRSPPAPAYNISICQSLGYFGNAVLKLLSHVSGPPLCGWKGSVARESGLGPAGLGTIEFSFSWCGGGGPGREPDYQGPQVEPPWGPIAVSAKYLG